MSNINKYLPKVLQPILEFQVINNTLDNELTSLEKRIKDINKEVIIATASEYGINKWEKTLGIIPKENESIEIRRFRIQNILNNKLPYSIRWLKNKLTQIVGNDSGWILNINYNDFKVTIILSGLDVELMGEVQKQLRHAIPANMVLEIGGEPLVSSDLILGTGTHLAYKVKLEGIKPIETGLIPLSKNKLPNLMQTNTLNGITYTVRDDKSIAVKGTASSRSEPILVAQSYTMFKGTYKYTGDLILILVTTTQGYVSFRKNEIKEIAEDIIVKRAYIRVENGQTVDMIYYPMLILNGEDETYKPFIGV